MMDEYLKLHKALSEAEVEYQKKFDAVKTFEDGLLMPNQITNIIQTLETWEKLKAEEHSAFIKREAARKDYGEFLRRIGKGK